VYEGLVRNRPEPLAVLGDHAVEFSFVIQHQAKLVVDVTPRRPAKDNQAGMDGSDSTAGRSLSSQTHTF